MNNAIKKATEYCLNCRVKPCSIKGCPLNNNIPAFIKLVKEENLKEAYKILSETTVLPSESFVFSKLTPKSRISNILITLFTILLKLLISL